MDLSANQLKLLDSYLDLVILWNDRIDLVAPASKEELHLRHIQDSIRASELLSRHVGEELVSRETFLLDVGSGGGIPAIPLSIIFPKLVCTLLEPRSKRVSFLEMAKEELGLSNINIEQRGLREFVELSERKSGYVKNFHISTIRGFPDDDLFLKFSKRILSSGGLAIKFAGSSYEPMEFKGYDTPQILQYNTIDPMDHRSLAVWRAV